MRLFLRILLFVRLSSLTVPSLAQWTTAPLTITSIKSTESVYGLAATTVGNKALFAGGSIYIMFGRGPYQDNTVNIYDDATGQWTTAQLSEYRTQIGAGSLGNLAFFAGGSSGGLFLTVNYSRVDIYNSTTNQWSTAELSLARANISVASAGNKILFAGGSIFSVANGGTFTPYNVVDIYDGTTKQWSISKLPRLSGGNIAAVSIGDQIWFAQNGLLDIYNVSTGQWSAASIPLVRNTYAVTKVGNKVLFVGRDYTISSKVAIYDVVTQQWSEADLSLARGYATTAISLGNKAYFVGGDNVYSTVIDVYNAITNQWSTIDYPQSTIGTLSPPASSVGNKLLFAGDGRLQVNIYTESVGNTPPTTSGIANQTIAVGQSFSLNVSSAFSDAETPNSLSFAATGLPPNLTLTGSTISGIASMTGISTVTVRATDPGNLTVSTPFTLAVVPTSGVGGPFQLLMPVYNCQTGAITFRTQGGDGSSIEYSGIGITAWSTNPNQVIDAEKRADPNSGTVVTLKARQSGKEVSLDFNFGAYCQSQSGNLPPRVNLTLASQRAKLGQSFNYKVPTSLFTDPESQTLTFSASNLPPGLSLDQNDKRLITGTPTQAGSFTVLMQATDPQGATASTPLIIVVLTDTPTEPNSLTVGQPIPNQIGLTGQFFTFTIPLSTFIGPVAFVDVSDLPAGLFYDGVTRTISGTVNVPDQRYITVTASDGLGHQVQSGFLLGFTKPNASGIHGLAVVQSIPDQTGTVGQLFTFKIPSGTFSGPVTNVDVSDLPQGLFYDGPNQTIVGTVDQPNVRYVTATASDGQGGLVQTSFLLRFVSAQGRLGLQAVPEIPFRVEVLGNPVEEELLVRIEGDPSQHVRLMLTSITGCKVSDQLFQLSSTWQEQRLSLKGQSAGVYLLHVQQGSHWVTQKLIRR